MEELKSKYNEDALVKRIRELNDPEMDDDKHRRIKKLKIDRLVFMRTLKHMIMMHDGLKRRYRASGDLRVLCKVNLLKVHINERRKELLADQEAYGESSRRNAERIPKNKRRETLILYDRNAALQRKEQDQNDCNGGGDCPSRIERGMELANRIRDNFRSALKKFKKCSISDDSGSSDITSV